MADIPGIIDVTNRQNTDICIAEMRVDIKYIREKLDSAVSDHENRIRMLESTDEECKQTDTIVGFQETLMDHESRINSLESDKDQNMGAENARIGNRELVSWGLTVVISAIAIWQFVGGK